MREEKFLFDTDVITNIVKPSPSKKLLRRLEKVPRGRQFISVITLAEIVYGASKSARPKFHIANLEQVILPRVNVLPFDARAAYHYGILRAARESSGRPMGHADLQIAATALAGGLVLVTGNMRHFESIPGLAVENWI